MQLTAFEGLPSSVEEGMGMVLVHISTRDEKLA
jgi:hypothetical protein